MDIPKINFNPSQAHGPGLPRQGDAPELTDEEVRERNVLNGLHPAQHERDRYVEARHQKTLDAWSLNKAYELNLTTASNIKPNKIDWLYPGYLAKGELTLLAGPTGVGKTAIACYLAAAMTVKDGIPINGDLKPISVGNVLFINTEDDVETSLQPRLIAAGANLDHIHYLNVAIGTFGKKPFSFANDEDIERLEQLNNKLEGSLDLIIVDPIYLAIGGDFTSNAKARQAYEKLRSIAKLLNCAILGIAHTVKSPKGKVALERIVSPSALREVPRVVLVLSPIVDRPTENGGNYVLVRAKSNLGQPDGGFEYDIKEAPTSLNQRISSFRFDITGILSGSADEILHEADSLLKTKTPNKLDLAKKLLKEKLINEIKVPGKDLIQLANELKISRSTLITAKQLLGVQDEKRKGDAITVWFFPSNSNVETDADLNPVPPAE